MPRLSERWKATLLVAIRESLVDPARSENHGMYGTPCARTGRPHARPSGLITGRAAQGTLRRYAWDERGWEVG